MRALTWELAIEMEYMIWRLNAKGTANLLARARDEVQAKLLVEEFAGPLGYTYALKWSDPFDASTKGAELAPVAPLGRVCTFAFGSLDGEPVSETNLLSLIRKIIAVEKEERR